MKTFSVLTILVSLVGLQTTSALAESCTALSKKSDTNARIASADLSNYSAGYRGPFLNLCAAADISATCAKIGSLIERDLSDVDFMNAYLPLLKIALEDLDDLKSRTAFNDFVMYLQGLHQTAKRANNNIGAIAKVMNTQKCGAILPLMKMTDVALVSDSAKDKTGQCKVLAIKVSGKTEYVLSVAGEDYPIKGVTYSSIPEVAKSLREALDAGSCL